ncbi:TraI domain-containing protein, partial [Lamprobacter modestohalophilus]|uniref:TraI domain-containing protein n=1 Tax=Lamprobacter modestohalophilus TaxID=1064514 RepID=UPI002ADED04E
MGLGDDDDGTPRWATYIEPVICRYAAFVHLLPASEAHHHCGSGGLLRHGLEVAFRATMLSQGVLVARDRPREQQLQIEP